VTGEVSIVRGMVAGVSHAAGEEKNHPQSSAFDTGFLFSEERSGQDCSLFIYFAINAIGV